MKRLLILVFTMITALSRGQDPVQAISKTYFRTHPFDSKFSSFILNLQKDPWFKIEEYYRRTDSTFFFLKGDYENFNPFRFLPKKLTLIVAEEEIIYGDSLQTRDTIINLQLIGVVDSTVANEKTVQKEYKRFNQLFANRFDDNKTQRLKWKEQTTGEINSYFISPLSVSPVTIAWGILPEMKQFSFSIIIRFKVTENHAVYIVQPGDLKGL